MKILGSSKTIANKLKELDLNNNWVSEVDLIASDLVIITMNNKISIPVDVIERNNNISQVDARWDWVEQTLSSVAEQPVLLEIHPRIINVIFQY